MNADKEDTIKQYSTFLEYHNIQPQEKTTPYEVPTKLWKVVGADIFMINNENLLCIVDYYRKFPVIKKVESLSPEDLLWAVRIVFSEFGLPKNWFQMQAWILCKSNLKIFAGAWTWTRLWHHHTTTIAMVRWSYAYNLWHAP